GTVHGQRGGHGARSIASALRPRDQRIPRRVGRDARRVPPRGLSFRVVAWACIASLLPESTMTVATASAAAAVKPSKPKRPVWPMVWELVRPRQGMLLLGLALMGINRVSGLVLPWSTKSLIDDVIGKRQEQLLLPLVGTVLFATLVQGATAFTLTQ